MRRSTKQEKKQPGQFRLLRCLSIEDNMRRLKKHVRRLERKLHANKSIRRFQFTNAKRGRATAAAATACAAS